MKTDTKNTLLAYEQPVSKEIRMRVQGFLCQSLNTANDGYGNNDLEDLD